MSPDLTRPLALVTGASSGLGWALADELASRGFDLLLAARSEADLRARARQLASAHAVHVRVEATDLTRPGQVARLACAAEARAQPLEVLANNAGIGVCGAHVEADPQREQDVIAVNVVALTALTRRLLPGMVRRGRGRILQVASTAAFVPGPFMAVYYASKAFVLSYAEALAEELEGTGVSVTCLCPGPMETDFQARAGMVLRGPTRLGLVDPRAVAHAGLEGALRGRRLVVPGWRNRLALAAARHLPRRWLTRGIARALGGRREPA